MDSNANRVYRWLTARSWTSQSFLRYSLPDARPIGAVHRALLVAHVIYIVAWRYGHSEKDGEVTSSARLPDNESTGHFLADLLRPISSSTPLTNVPNSSPG